MDQDSTLIGKRLGTPGAAGLGSVIEAALIRVDSVESYPHTGRHLHPRHCQFQAGASPRDTTDTSG